eukprot:3203397-Alexandrium_andersonii.AAC.1
MSASLVGSEMCIRDSMSPEAIEAARLLAVQCNEELRRQKSGLPLSAVGSVSYTHLTLPTICSV